jgi:hypothetical protein
MDTHKAIAELAGWAATAANGDAERAEQHVQQFYHIGSSLIASKEFQSLWKAKYHARLEPGQLDEMCNMLAAIADVEASQVAMHGRAAA